MKVEYGHVRKYIATRGFGFVTRTFDNTIRQDNKHKDVFFHITAIQDDFPDLAQRLNQGFANDVYFWYLIDTSERDKVDKIWLDINDIPDPYQKDLFSYIERLSNHLSPLLEQINNICLATEKHKEQTLISNQLKLKETDKTKPLEIEAKKVDVHKIELEKSEPKKAQTNEIIRDEKYYDGLPEDLIDSVFWVGREFRIHPLSDIQGGHNMIIEYHDGRILEYDWVHFPNAYIRKIVCGLLRCNLNEFNNLSAETIMDILSVNHHRIFINQYRKDSSSKLFREVWNSEIFDSIRNILKHPPNGWEFYLDNKQDMLEALTRLKEQERRKNNSRF